MIFIVIVSACVNTHILYVSTKKVLPPPLLACVNTHILDVSTKKVLPPPLLHAYTCVHFTDTLSRCSPAPYIDANMSIIDLITLDGVLWMP